MPVTTASAAVHIAPVVLKRLFEHGAERKGREDDGKEVPQDDILFDEAFHIVKSFMELGTKNTVESLQAFTNTCVPSPYWAAVSPVMIPLSSCNEAADALMKWFGPEELQRVVGGERWWQVRGLDGIDAEWIAERDHIGEDPVDSRKKLSRAEQDIIRMERLESVMFYVHGGGYFWGSINTHRYQILRHAHKLKGRAFAVNYRKAPQYPWPCPIHDVLAAYLYLIRPPPGALHQAVHPSKIVFSGDSAGGGLCLSVMCLLRDLGLPMPAGAALISPWVDLTHSFPSVMTNTETDIIPPHGFLAKPSELWPLDPLPATPRIAPTKTNPPPLPGDVDTLKPTAERREAQEQKTDITKGNHKVETQEEMLEKYKDPPANQGVGSGTTCTPTDSAEVSGEHYPETKEHITEDTKDHWEPKPAKILMENDTQVPLEIRSQIELYATSEQLTHPLVSPISQGTLCNLPPLYIIAGDGEVLRDEIVYLAHRAAYPSDYPVRESVLKQARRQQENVEKFTNPTKVHLQVFDGMCHVVTVFMFTKSARYAYRSISEFIKHVTQAPQNVVERNPFPKANGDQPGSQSSGRKVGNKPTSKVLRNIRPQAGGADALLNKPLLEEVTNTPEGRWAVFQDNGTASRMETLSPEADEAEYVGEAVMLRERVDVHGLVRPMEAKEDVTSLQIPPDRIGQIREAPAMRWLRGQEEWDRRYRKRGERVLKKREKLIKKADRIITHALDQGLVHEAFPESVVEQPVEKASGRAVTRKTSIGEIQNDRRWGPLDLKGENPPGSAIAARRDTGEALALLRKSIYHTAPITHQTVPRLKASDALRATLDPHDNPNEPPQQSVAEEQVDRLQIPALHGLRIWEKILGYLGRKSAAKATNGIKSTAAVVHRDSKE